MRLSLDLEVYFASPHKASRCFVAEFDDFIDDLAKDIQRKEQDAKVADAAQLLKVQIHNRRVAALWEEFRSYIRRGVEGFNKNRSIDDLASIPRDSSEELAIDFQGRCRFSAKLIESVVTKLHFIPGANGDAVEWFTLLVNQKQELVITDKHQSAVDDAEGLARRALKLAFR